MSRRSIAFAIALLASGPPGVFALDPHREPSQYVVTTWGSRNLPGSSVHALFQTSDEYLWIGTTSGLVRFDGARFVAFDARRSPGFVDGGASSLAQGPDGTLYVGSTSGSVMQYRHGTFTKMATPSGAGLVSALCLASDGSLWGGVHGVSMYRWNNGRVDLKVRAENVKSPLAIVEGPKGVIWIGTGEGLSLIHI